MGRQASIKDLTSALKVSRRILQSYYKFREYSPIYKNTNENLRDTIPNLEGKDVLTVSASGDQAINMIVNGARRVDTFDINLFSPLFQTLKLYAIKYLDEESVMRFFRFSSSDIDKIYSTFSDKLPPFEKEFFDYLFSNYDSVYLFSYLFHQNIGPYILNNNYYDSEVLSELKDRIPQVAMKHYSTDLAKLPQMLRRKYDSIFLSNISEYYKKPNMFFETLEDLEAFLNENGKIYFAYLYHKCPDDVPEAIRMINLYFRLLFDEERFADIIDNTTLLRVRGSEYANTSDTVLVYQLKKK